MQIFWFIPTHGDSRYLGTTEGARQLSQEYLQQVAIAATDYGVDPVVGELLFAGSEELILRREDARAGVVHVHFPRVGFRLEAC